MCCFLDQKLNFKTTNQFANQLNGVKYGMYGMVYQGDAPPGGPVRHVVGGPAPQDHQVDRAQVDGAGGKCTGIGAMKTGNKTKQITRQQLNN